MEDFHSLDCIKSRFEVWRKEYPDCYRDAYIGLCLPRLFSPLVRLQLITWNPLQVGVYKETFSYSGEGNKQNCDIKLCFNCIPIQEPCPNFEYMLWFESLLFYGFEEHTTLQIEDGDLGLLPAIIEKVILSKLSGSQTCLAALSILRGGGEIPWDAVKYKICHEFLFFW